MKCPYRINQKVEKHYSDFQGNNPYLNVEHYFPDCIKKQCPWYKTDDHFIIDRCLQVECEIKKASGGAFDGNA